MAKLAIIPSDAPTVLQRQPRRPVLVSVRGRHETGKTTLLSLLIDTARGDYPLRIVDADTNNQTLSAWFPHAVIPAGVGEARRLNVEAEFNWSMDNAGTETQGDMMCDLGGEDTILPRLGAELGYAEALAESGVDPVLIYVIGPDVRHLKPIEDMENGKLFCPPRTVVAFNAGLVPMDRSADDAYAEVIASETIRKILDRGARRVNIPSLDIDCMRKIKVAVEAWHVERNSLRADGKEIDRPTPGFKWALSAEGRRVLGMTDHLRVKAFIKRFNDGPRAKLADWIPE
jgi:hypothetical protein